jgi:DNA-binding SARP family transcriptional activator
MLDAGGYGSVTLGLRSAGMEFRILGPLEVLDEGRPVPIRGAKERALLTILLLHANEPVTVDRLIEELWGDAPPPTARKSLQVRVATLRRAHPEGVLSTRGESYAIRLAGDQLDLHLFERLVSDGRQALADGDPRSAAAILREALALWRGPPLADFAHESFAEPAIARLEELRLAALELRIEAELALGLHERLVGELKELVAMHPFRERLRGQLMLALYRDGRQAEALELYQRTRDTFVEELGIEPGPALQELQRAVLRHDAALAPAKLPEPERSILVAPRGRPDMEALLGLAESLARRPARELILARLVPRGSDVGDEAARLNERRQELLARGIAVRTAAFTTVSRGDDLVRLAVEQDVDLLLLDGTHDLGTAVVEKVLTRAPCDVAVHVAREQSPSTGPVVVLFGGGEHDWAAIEVGAWIAGAREAVLKLAGPARGRERDASRSLASASLAVQRGLGIAAEPVLVAPSDQAVLAAVADAAIVVAGLPERWKHEGLGRVRTVLAKSARPPVLLVRRGLRPGGLAPRESLTRFTWTIAPP